MDPNAKIEAAKGAPAVAGAFYSAVTLNEVVALATLAYVALQAAYLVWKWRKEYKDHERDKS